MKARIVRIGNSRGVRIPKPLLEEAGLEDEVHLTLAPDGILISPATVARAGWTDAASLIRERGEAGLLDAPLSTRFDESVWEWDENGDSTLDGVADECED